MAEHKTLAEALAAFQAVVPKMSKDETAKVKSDKANYTYGYAGLDQFVEIVEPVLGQHGMAVTSRTTFTDNLFMLEVSLVHEGGERETAYWPLPDPRRAGPQDLGSAMTYGRRYLGWGLTGTFPGGIDDDGAQAQTAPRDSWESAAPRRAPVPAEDRQAVAGQEAQAAAAPPTPKTSWTDVEVAEILAKMPTAGIGKVIGAYDWMAGKKLHKREVTSPLPGGGTVDATRLVALIVAEEALKPTASVAGIADLRNTAADRGLLKILVDGDDTLEKVLHEARDLAAHEAAEDAGQPSSPIESDADIRQES